MGLTVDTPAGAVVTLGATKVAAGASVRGREALVGGLPGVVSWQEDGTPLSVRTFTVTAARITRITAVVDPAGLTLMNLLAPA
ncbi:hypothetical protein [Streptomyces sp. YKOK-I1]